VFTRGRGEGGEDRNVIVNKSRNGSFFEITKEEEEEEKKNLLCCYVHPTLNNQWMNAKFVNIRIFFPLFQAHNINSFNGQLVLILD
jgi:hypothetical protein